MKKYCIVSIYFVIIFYGCDKIPSSVDELDISPPVILLTSPADKTVIGSSILIKADASDNNIVRNVSFYIDGALFGTDSTMPFEILWYTNYTDGTIPHTLYAKAKDKAGNIGVSDLISVTISSTANQNPSLLAPSNNASVETSLVEFVWSQYRGATSYELEVLNNTNVVISITLTDTSYNTILALGKHTWKIRAINSNGEKSSWSEIFNISINERSQSEPSQTVLLFPQNNSTNNTDSIIFQWRKSIDAKAYEIEIYANSELFISKFVSDTFYIGVVKPGQNIWRVRSINSGNLKSIWSSTFSFIVKQSVTSSGVVFGGNGIDYFSSSIIDKYNNYILAGHSESGANGIFVVKLNLSKDIIFSKIISHGGSEIANKIIEAMDGSYIIVGYSNNSSEEGFITKTDTDGNILWSKSIGGVGADNIKSIIELSGGDLLLVGYSSTNSNGNYDGWIVKMSFSGNILFNKVFGTSSDEGFTDIISCGDGTFMVTGYAFRDIEYDAWIVKIDPDGNEIFSKYYGTSSREWAGSIYRLNNGGYIVSGQTFSGNGSSDGWIYEINEAGEILWSKNYGTSGYDLFTFVKEDYANNIFVGGYKSNGFEQDAWTLKLTSSGIILWEKQYGGVQFDDFSSGGFGNNGDIILSGSSRSFGIGSRDGYFLIADPLTGNPK